VSEASKLQDFKPAGLSVLTQAVTAVVLVVFLVTLVMSFWSGGLVTRLTCIVLGLTLVGCWLFSVKGYLIDGRSIIVQHPLWSARFELRGLVPEDHRPGNDSIRLFASNWVFGHTLGLCYNRKVGTFFVYMTDPRYRLDIETKRGVVVISPRDRDRLAAILAKKVPG
jgi:Bacterial PH domain